MINKNNKFNYKTRKSKHYIIIVLILIVLILIFYISTGCTDKNHYETKRSNEIKNSDISTYIPLNNNSVNNTSKNIEPLNQNSKNISATPVIENQNIVIENPNQVCYKNNCYNVELALTPSEQATGLMYRTNLPKDNGMLFIFNEDSYHSFWMKNTLIPLDIIWIDSNKTIAYIKKNAEPCPKEGLCPGINPGKKAMYVLELNSGISNEIGLNEGEKVNIYIS